LVSTIQRSSAGQSAGSAEMKKIIGGKLRMNGAILIEAHSGKSKASRFGFYEKLKKLFYHVYAE
jgi:hypothetical protein